MSAERPTHRREFLKGRSAAESISGWSNRGGESAADSDIQSPDLTPAAGPGEEIYLTKFARRAMACDFELLFDSRRYPGGGVAAIEALDLIDALEEQLSVYRATSEISNINRMAHLGPVEVERRFFELLVEAEKLNAATGGAFDITSGPLIKVWGFRQRAGAVPSEAALREALELVGMDKVRLDAERRTIEFARAGMEIDLGAIGKGYALDRAGEVLQAAGTPDFLFHAGTSSVLARGSSGGVSPDEGWTVSIRDPLRPGRSLGNARLVDRALATSGVAVQHFRAAGKSYGHLLDPRDGRPAHGMHSATVLAPTAARADALSTAFFVGGLTCAEEYHAKHLEIAAILVVAGENGGPERVVTLGTTSDIWTSWESSSPAPPE